MYIYGTYKSRLNGIMVYIGVVYSVKTLVYYVEIKQCSLFMTTLNDHRFISNMCKNSVPGILRYTGELIRTIDTQEPNHDGTVIIPLALYDTYIAPHIIDPGKGV